jgi:hypothetical protein
MGQRQTTGARNKGCGDFFRGIRHFLNKLMSRIFFFPSSSCQFRVDQKYDLDTNVSETESELKRPVKRPLKRVKLNRLQFSSFLQDGDATEFDSVWTVAFLISVFSRTLKSN